MNFDLAQWVLAGLAALVVGLSKTGVPGVGMLSVAIFANLLPTKQASGFVLPLLLCGDLVAVFSYRRHTEWKHLRRLFLWTGSGVVLGAVALGRIDDRQARLLVGGIVVALVGLHLWRKRSADGLGGANETQHGAWFAPMIGVLAGFTTLVANAAGPLMAIYLLAMRLPKLAFIGTSAVFFLLLNLFKVPFMIGLGLITPESARFNLVLVPAVLAGALAGRWALPRVSQTWFERLALLLSAVAGLKLLLG
ncbi:MAG: sulfite exporter TauE/SafE family protein [Verrucomicrobia bacterium]|nr:sulfite exporter TauE/SafE family protein [Verrucomicrobiota bacterium]